MAARVPAWKKLGLKLKSDPQSDVPSTPAAPQRPAASFQRDAYDSPKRKREQFDSPAAWKKPKTDDRQAGPPLHRQRSVTFANGTDSNATPVQKKAKSAPKQKKPKGPKNTEPPPPPDLTVPLEYLRLWKTSRDSWKFNKIHQAHLISHAFDPSLLPAADIDTFFDYIGELKGYAKTRMVETAKNICTEDMDEEKDHFPAGTSDVESKKKQYEEIMSNLERKKSESKRKHFREVDFTSRDVDPEVARRVAKRMRAEIVVEEHGGESEGSEETGDSSVPATSEKEPSNNEAPEEPDAGKRVKLNDGTTRPAKRVRASKRRGGGDSSSESSDSDSDSEDESDNEAGPGVGSSSSSSDSDDDEDKDSDSDEE